MIRFRRPVTVQVDRRMNSYSGQASYLKNIMFHVKHDVLKVASLPTITVHTPIHLHSYWSTKPDHIRFLRPAYI